MSNPSQITSPRLSIMLAGVGILLLGSLLLLTQVHAAQTGSEPVLSNIASTPTNTGATITWKTDQASNGQIFYGTTSGGENATSSLNDTSTGTTTHTAFLGGLTPNTTYFFKVISQLVGSTTNTTATSSELTFTTTNTGSTTASTTTATAPMISNVMASTTDTSATITWNTDVRATSQVLYGLTNAYGNTSLLADTGTGVMSHSVLLVGLTPKTTYHFQVQSFNGSSTTSTSTDMTFTTTNTASSTSTGSTTIDMLQSEITVLQARVTTLESEVAGLLGGTTGTGSTTPPTSGRGTIDQNGASVNAGGSIDLSGRNFGHEETVIVTLNGAQVATAHADGGGNFSTGSIPAPATAGTYTYMFAGQTSGITASATVTVH